MENTGIPRNNWDGQLPPHIAKNEQIWWEVFPQIRCQLPPKILGFFGAAKESPSRETIGKVILVAHTKGNLGALYGSLMNDWGTYCQSKMDKNQMVYMAGTATNPFLSFEVPTHSLLLFTIMRFGVILNPDPDMEEAVNTLVQDHIKMIKELNGQIDLEKSDISILKFKRGSWEHGLDTAFKAAIWINSNREEALANIWKGTIS